LRATEWAKLSCDLCWILLAARATPVQKPLRLPFRSTPDPTIINLYVLCCYPHWASLILLKSNHPFTRRPDICDSPARCISLSSRGMPSRAGFRRPRCVTPAILTAPAPTPIISQWLALCKLMIEKTPPVQLEGVELAVNLSSVCPLPCHHPLYLHPDHLHPVLVPG
jgi:hypothetical protein